MTTLPATADALARDPRFADGTWRDSEGRSLLDLVVWAYGSDAGWAMWRDAERIFFAEGLDAAATALPLAKTRRGVRHALPLVLHAFGRRPR